MRAVVVLCGLLALGLSAPTPIKHVIVLMEENRSFDHMFGFNKDIPVDGLQGNETNPYNTTNPHDPRGSVRVNNTSPYIGPFDPCHGTPCTTEKIFGSVKDHTVARMDGFIEYEAKHHSDPSSVLNMFTPDRLPIISALAKEFAVFDKFFAAHPGPTWPNRLFCLSATSAGCTETGTWYEDKENQTYPQKSIFDSFNESGLTWKNYYADTPWELFLGTLAKHENKKHIQDMDAFRADVAAGTLPNFAWINPRAGVNKTTGEGSNDQHPDHDVALGEALMKEIYETLRAGPAWNETLFIITYDEHGGFYDHVPTPLSCPAPDDHKSYPDSFDFKREGVRIPTLLISPWIRKGTVIHEPEGFMKPYADSQYDLTSIPATMKKMFDLPSFLTRRDSWSGTFEGFLTELDKPRTDCPKVLPPAPKFLSKEATEWEASQPLNELQRNFIRYYELFNGADGSAITTQGDVSEFLRREARKFLGH